MSKSDEVSKADEAIAIGNCDREPVHIPGRVQPFGALFAFDPKQGRIVYQSENLSSIIPLEETVCIGQNFEEMIANRHAVHAMRGSLSLPTIRSQRDRAGVFDIGGKNVDVSVYSTGGNAVVELEHFDEAVSGGQSPVSSVRAMMSTITQGAGMSHLLDSSVRVLRHLTGHDRVMAYRFLQNGDGEVVAEANGPEIEPYLGLRYPAWDIPTQVRQIMLRSPFRVIHDTRSKPASLITADGAPPLDMTLGHLRGVSPIHIEYLENMGLRSTMNVSIIVRGQLWGLFAFHHYRPRMPTADQRSICELFGQIMSMMIQQEEERTRLDARRLGRSTIAAIGARDGIEADLGAVIERLATDLMSVVDANGLGVVSAGSATLLGDCPSEDVARELCNSAKQELVSINRLGAVRDWPSHESLGKTAGALLLGLPQGAWLAFFRNEVKHEIRWAGQKEKTLTYGPNGPRLSPRGSFAEYTESVSGRCNDWTQADLEGASEISREMWKLTLSTTDGHTRQLEREKKYQDLLIAELNHRVRNTLALVRSIARQTTSASGSVEQYVEMLEQRIAALSKAHDLIGASGIQWARIVDIVRAELKPYEFDQQNVLIDGPPIAVRADAAPLLALVLHEMTSNAVKHGALSGAGGSLDVRWYGDAGGVSIVWTETLLDEIQQVADPGFGFTLIERAVPHECGGKSSIEVLGCMLRISLWFPAESIDLLGGKTQPSEQPSGIERADANELSLADLDSALVVEDNIVLAMELERMLLDLGVTSVDTFPNAELAQEAIERKRYQCAVLDINLGEGNSFGIATALQAAGAAVVFASGYDNTSVLPDSLAGTPAIIKPVSKLKLVDAIRNACQEI